MIYSFDTTQEEIALAKKIIAEGKFVEGKHANGLPYQEGDDLVTFSKAIELGDSESFTLDVTVRNPDKHGTPHIDVECFGPQGDLIGSEAQCELFDYYEMNGFIIILDESKFIELEAFEIARLGKDALYSMVEEKTGINDIQEMELVPVGFDESCVIYQITNVWKAG